MKEIEPFYYSEFKCIGNECNDNCCEFDWIINVDDSTIEKYKNLNGSIRDTILNAISEEKNIIMENKKCPFLSKNRLCNIYIKLGEEYMCKTCRIYPRIVINYDNYVTEKALYASCPVIAEILVKHNEPITFVIKNDEQENNDTKISLTRLLYESKMYFIKIMQNREIVFWKRLISVMYINDKIEKAIDNGNISKLGFNAEKSINEDNLKLGFELLNKFYDDSHIEELLKAFDSFDVIYKNKFEIVFELFEILFKLKIEYLFFNESGLPVKLKENITMVIDFINDAVNKNDLEGLSDIYKEFELSFSDKEYIYENYIVHFIYSYYIEISESKYSYKFIPILCMGYAIIKFIICAKWYLGGKKIKDDEIIDIIYTFSRFFEHNFKTKENIYKQFKNYKYDSLANLIVLVR